MYLPASTYRLQFNKDFSFKDLERALPYLLVLSPGAFYASPFFKAVPGSNHGYDVTNPLEINPEIGTADEYSKLNAIIQKNGIGWLQDIVPNHMAFHPDNEWLMDVMRFGKNSEFADFFDINWDHPVYKNKVMVPVLGDLEDNLIKEGQITLRSIGPEIWLTYGDFRLPVNPGTIKPLLTKHSDTKKLCRVVNSNPEMLDSLIQEQHYVLTKWQEANRVINYRRFFTINGLISLKMENLKVYLKYHQLIFKMAIKHEFNGIRLDHVDGLSKPVEYFHRLRADLGNDMYITSEKILEINERIDPYWPIQGTTGYDFMSLLNSLLTGNGVKSITDHYRRITGIRNKPEEIIYNAKHAVLSDSFSGDLDNIFRMITEKKLPVYADLPEELVKEALAELLVCCPVYKLYSDSLPLQADDMKQLDDVFSQALKNKQHLRDALLSLKALFMDGDPENTNLFLRLMQYTGPLMAKGVEDTVMYTWVPYIARNEVGDSLDAPSLTAEEFHHLMTERRNTIPASMNATATHDTKRGEDTRARLSVISDIPSLWIRFYNEWSALTRDFVVRRDQPAPDENERYFICQVIVGSLPMEGKPDAKYITRLQEYIRKALREAKINTNWNTPDEDYEKAVIEFCAAVLKNKNSFSHLMMFVRHIRDYGIINSLTQVILKSTCPGIPDFYQGTELWDLSFVDPDNRRMIDYNVRKKMLDAMRYEIRHESGFFENLYRSRFSGNIKLWLVHRLMSERFKNPEAFVEGDYIPLKVTGTGIRNILAFLRVYHNLYYVIIVPLHLASAEGTRVFKDVIIRLPVHAPDTWYDLWDDRVIRTESHEIAGTELKTNMPQVLKGTIEETKRGSGILMHITSLPGKYGNGSLGKEAFDFIGLLKQSGQKYWQLLPFNPAGAGNSPYSSQSAFAGNMLFIDPEILYRQHRLKKLPKAVMTGNKTDFRKGLNLRKEFLKETYDHFKSHHDPLTRKNFEGFCAGSSYWIDDFALFSELSEQYGDEWIKWPSALGNHDSRALKAFTSGNEEQIERKKFIQYIFHEQFSALKSFADSSGINLIGDIPVYVSYNSADVWSHRELFNLNEDGSMKTIAGVPPDFFSSNGQLWNMPVYNWKKMQESHYDWWIQRIRRNLTYGNLLRLDHFRALSAFWEVPAGESTARNGKWTEGPGAAFLSALRSEFTILPLIAEDLGDIDEEVLNLRDQFNLPGMKVLMFAFDAGMPRSFHIPHNYQENSVVYTGTHDNNTVRGWYKGLDSNSRKRVNAYLDKSTSATSIAWDMIRLALNSVSRISVVPLQDILNLDEQSRMNIPAQKRGNWSWKLADFGKLEKACEKMMNLTYNSGRK